MRLGDPLTIGWHPFGIPYYLGNLSLADDYWILLHSNADFVCPYLLAVLPKCQPKGWNINSDLYVRLTGLQWCFLNFPSREFVRLCRFGCVSRTVPVCGTVRPGRTRLR